MQAIRNSHKVFVPNQLTDGDNLALRLSKLNADIDNTEEHEQKDRMLDMLSAYTMSKEQKSSYQYAFNQWKGNIDKRRQCIGLSIRSVTKCLLGMGNASVHEFGVSLSHPFGVPIISANTIKGLLSSYLSRHGGDAWYKSNKDSKKSDLQVELFGGDIEQDNRRQSWMGAVIFYDAWLLPDNNKWFVPDIINVHYSSYYSGKELPNGMENPIPVKIAAMAPGLEFFLAIEADEDILQFILPVLERALMEEGIGSKTATGYGRFELTQPAETIITERKQLQEEFKQQEQARKEQAEFDSLPEHKKIIHNLNKHLQRYKDSIMPDDVKTEINTIINNAENTITDWSSEDRQALADFMEQFFEQTGWSETGIKSNKKKKQKQKKLDRILKIRGEIS